MEKTIRFGEEMNALAEETARRIHMPLREVKRMAVEIAESLGDPLPVVLAEMRPAIMGGDGEHQDFIDPGRTGVRPPGFRPPGTPTAPEPANAIEEAIRGFTERLDPFNTQLSDLSQQFITQGMTPGDDPLTAQLRQQGAEAQRGALARTGVTGSAALNQIGRVNTGFDQQSLARKDQLVQGGVSLGQMGLQNELAIPGLEIARTAAERAGGGGGKK